MSTGKFEVLAITAGEGNGWTFSEDVLLKSLPLWDGVDCYVDHGGWFGERSVRDLGGVFRNPRWVEEDKGVRMDLVTMGPSGELISELGRQILVDGAPFDGGPKPKVGFSADVLFTAKGKDVQSILRVIELCVVVNPARGGAFIRALNSAGSGGHGGIPAVPQHIQLGGSEMGNTQNTAPAAMGIAGEQTSPPTGGGGDVVAQLQKDAESIRGLLAVQQEREALAREAEAA